MQRVYLDYNATTPVDPEVIEAMVPYFAKTWGNASSTHYEGQQARAAVENAREQVASLVGCTPKEIVFTSGGTEADNLALFGLARRYGHPPQRVLYSAIEHPAVRESARALAHEGFRVEEIPITPDGVVDINRLSDSIDSDILLIAVMAVNNETGVIQPLEAIGSICAERNFLFHVDAVQAAGKIPLQPRLWQCSTMAMSGHKIYGPKGIGALYLRHEIELVPVLHGGGHERGRRAGTENTPGIVGFGKACELARVRMESDAAHIAQMRQYLETELNQRLPDALIYGAKSPRVPNTTMMGFPGVEGETLVMQLDLEGFAVSSGSACASGRVETSHVLKAMGVDEHLAKGSIRISLGRLTSLEEIEAFVQTLERILRKSRRGE